MEKNLQSSEAQKKFKQLAEEIRVCMFITNTQSNDEHTRPMSTIEVEDDGTLWFFTDIRSIKIEEIDKEKDVHLTYAHPGNASYMDVWGKASLITDRAMIKAKWSPIIKAWFPGGDDDPNAALLKIVPTDCYYWETESGKMIQFLKMAAAAVAGKPLANGTEGSLKV